MENLAIRRIAPVRNGERHARKEEIGPQENEPEEFQKEIAQLGKTYDQETRRFEEKAVEKTGQEWIRTTEGVSQRIYSPPRLATSVPTRFAGNGER